jgi:hypothetical protein
VFIGEKMKFLVFGGFDDLQTGLYICLSLKDMGHKVDAIDSRKAFDIEGAMNSQAKILEELDELNEQYDVIIVLKGIEFNLKTLLEIRTRQPNAKIVNWFFDKYLSDRPIWEIKEYFGYIKFFDYYFCSSKGVADKLNECGFPNAMWLPEGYYPPLNGEVYMNNFQKKKYGSDVSFCGTLGFLKQHSNRIPILDYIAREKFDMKVWGSVVCEWKNVPPSIRANHQMTEVINESHSMVSRASLINIGIDQDPTLDMGYSARLYRVLGARGLYLTTATKGIQKEFKINAGGEMPTGEEEVIVYYGMDSLSELIDFLLEHDDIREKIAENGQNKVFEKHKFSDRLEDMIKIIKGD